jgi:hypothetical protein
MIKFNNRKINWYNTNKLLGFNHTNYGWIYGIKTGIT